MAVLAEDVLAASKNNSSTSVGTAGFRDGVKETECRGLGTHSVCVSGKEVAITD